MTICIPNRLTMNWLRTLRLPGIAATATRSYTADVAETAATRGGSRNSPGRTTAFERFFYVRTSSAFYGRALAGVRSRTPVPLDAGLPTLLCARPPHLEVGTGLSNPSKEAASMRLALARPEQSPLSAELLSIIRRALRAAVQAPSDAAALDISADALLAVASLVQSEVRHG